MAAEATVLRRRTIRIHDHTGRDRGDGDVTQVSVLGPLRLHRGGHELLVRRPAQRRVLALLLLEPGRPVPMDLLVERFWRDAAPRSARRAIHTHVSAVRGIVGPHLIDTVADGYRWVTRRSRLDLEDFTQHARRAETAWRSGDAVATHRSASAGLARWSDPPFAELADDDFARPAVEHLRCLQRRTTELHADALIALDRSSEAIPELAAASAAAPLDERFAMLLAVAQRASGRPADALSTLANVRRELRAAGLTPSPELGRLVATLRRDVPDHDGVRAAS